MPSPKPVNVLVSRNAGLTVADLASLGVRRSVGSTLARAAWSSVMQAAKTVASKAASPVSTGWRLSRTSMGFSATT